MELRLAISGDAVQRLQAAPGLLQQGLMQAALGIAQRSAADLRADAEVPEWTGNLKDGMRAIPTADGAMMLVEASYARWVHDGRQPGGFPNVDNLADWAKDHGMAGAEWAIAYKIAKRGVAAKPFLSRYVSSLQFEAMAKRVLLEEVGHALA